MNITVLERYNIELKSHTVAKLLAIVGSIVVVVFGVIELIAAVRGRGDFGFDRVVLLQIHKLSTPFLDALFVHTTDIGGVAAIIIITLIIAGYLAYRRKTLAFLIVTGSVAGAAILMYTLKTFVERPRPNLWGHHLITEKGFSFVSGHSTMSMTVAVVLVVILWNTKWRWLAIVGGGLYAVYVAFSRLYLGVHYPTDILGGWILALSWVAVVVISLRLLLVVKKADDKNSD